MTKQNRKRLERAAFIDRYISAEDRGEPIAMIMSNNGASVGRRLNRMRLAEIRKCPECRLNSHVLLTKKKIPCCELHWNKLADAQIGWNEEG